MKYSYALAVLPAMALATPTAVKRQDSGSAIEEAVAAITSLEAAFVSEFPACATLTDAVGVIACVDVYRGMNTAAAAYLAEQIINTDYDMGEVAVIALNTDLLNEVLTQTDGPAYYSHELAAASSLPSSIPGRAALISVDAMALSLQDAAPTGASGSGSSGSSSGTTAAAGGSSSGSSPKATGSSASSSSGTSSSSSKAAAAPAQTGLGLAAAAAAGIAGLAFAL